jgi:UDP-N-acetylmuramoyl-L-alanyl-D-glutamate--2,6-diaminopimelate ligase
MQNYRKVKMEIFKNARVAIVNLDMNKPEDFLQFKNRRKITYSIKTNQADVFANNISLNVNNSVFWIDDQKFTLSMPGEFNIENALAAASVGISEGIDLPIIAKVLEKISSIPGRIEYVPNDKGFKVLVDFALTPDALEKLYGLLARIKDPGAKVIAVFGACGERDRGNRPLVGETISRFADHVIVTNDEPYHEDPDQIIKEIVEGIKNKEKNEDFWIIPDRREAIKKALHLAKAGDIIAVTGMGAEESMVVGNKKIPWNDRKVIIEELKNL